ncbi:unnamed protein product [Eruca vesicaria subsp. sativa]|uniref:Uncharacterized protein n=1 Tax=Eruca vesicaria subsp. sativa TaxID=29727 RepID=A0ABC8LWL8_ERUVS|nr:unnamed protein product [Eruca vesicaria subsp. sativa]
MLTAASFLPTRLSRFVFFLLCSPILLPLLCLSIPLLCAVEIFSRLRCRIAKSAAPSSVVTEVLAAGEDDLRRCEEGCGELVAEEDETECSLLERYLEDQARSIYDCGVGDEEDEGGDRDPIRVPLLS